MSYVGGSCVSNCQNFPSRSCIIGGRDVETASELCPRTDMNPNGTNFNTGSCMRRCGMVGTGRSDRINNGTSPNSTQVDPIPCCVEFEGDYCCNYEGKLQPNCAFGRVVGGPVCGVPIRGTSTNLYTPQNNPNNRPPFYPPPFYGPARPYYPPPMQWGPPMSMPYYREMGSDESLPQYAQDTIKAAKQLEERQFVLPPIYLPPRRQNSPRPPPPFYPPPYGPRPPPFTPQGPPIVPPPSSQRPSLYICSCDDDCRGNYYDCCDDYDSYCTNFTR